MEKGYIVCIVFDQSLQRSRIMRLLNQSVLAAVVALLASSAAWRK
jgi:hypothetical protein